VPCTTTCRIRGLTNNQWYQQFVIHANLAASQGVVHQHGVLGDFVAKKLHGKKYDELTDPLVQEAVCKDAADRYMAFVFLSQSGQKHNQLRADLKNHQFMAGHDNYPTTIQAMLRFLDNYDQQNTAAVTTISEGAAFAQKTKPHPGYNGDDYVPEFWQTKTNQDPHLLPAARPPP
jgi:hypothetical protein